MFADLICVGNELLTGLTENSNSGFLSRRALVYGYQCKRIYGSS
jgi:molybdopterin-biosynthesis enzyme MoeA-like protein